MRRMLTLFTHETVRPAGGLPRGLGLQARGLARTILDPDRPYRPVRWKELDEAGTCRAAGSHPREGTMLYLITYDIADDQRREDVATLLSGYGPRVQLSVLECDLRSRREATGLRLKLRELINAVRDQVRLYPLDDRAARDRVVLGARVIKERQGLLDRHVSLAQDSRRRVFGSRLAHRKSAGQRPAGHPAASKACLAGRYPGRMAQRTPKRPDHRHHGKAPVANPRPTSRA